MPCVERTLKSGKDGRPLRVLIVEDCADTADSQALLVRLWGHEAVVAYRGDTALALASGQRFDVVLLDVGLPGLSGLELAQKLRALPGFGQSLIVAVTGHGRPIDRAHCLEAGCDAFLLKPVDPEAIRQLLAAGN